MGNTIQAVEIMLVEDNPNDVALIVRALQKHNLTNRLKLCEDGEEALNYLFPGGFSSGPLNGLPRVVFLDLKLPKINGLEVLKEIRSHPGTRTLPVVVVTSSREDPDVRAAYELGANSYVVKPVRFEDFLKVISELGFYWLIINEPLKN